jgi:hypothetical protein
MPIAVLPAFESQIVRVQSEVAQPETASPAHAIVQLAGATLAFLGREVAPRLVDVLITALERRLERPITTAVTPLPTSSRVLTTQIRGRRRHARYRGRRSKLRNHEERR